MKTLPLSVCVILLRIALAGAAEPAPPRRVAFARKPVVTKESAGCKIDFAAAAPTDCAVYVLDAKGKVVRHLAAGALGEKAPKPLRAGLAQSLVWDGKDDLGRPAAGGPFTVRVGLGIRFSFDRMIGATPPVFGAIRGLTVGPKGELYVLNVYGHSHPFDGGTTCLVLDRDGKYLRTILPYPANLPEEKLKGVKRIELDGGVKIPFIYQAETRSFLPGAGDIFPQRPVATRDGRVVFVGHQEVEVYRNRGTVQLVVIHADGRVP
ncbi:MAG: flagellar hook assembly protein FlgD, partial [Planctomycetota bacterium]